MDEADVDGIDTGVEGVGAESERPDEDGVVLERASGILVEETVISL